MNPKITFLILCFVGISAVFCSDENFYDNNYDQIYDISGSKINPDLDSLYLLPNFSVFPESMENLSNITIQSEAFIFLQKIANCTTAQIQMLMDQDGILNTLNKYLQEEQNPIIKTLIIKTYFGLVNETNVYYFIKEGGVYYYLVSLLPTLDDSSLEEAIKFVTKLAYYGDTYQRCTIFTLLYPHLDNFMANINDKIVYQTSLMLSQLTNGGLKCDNIFFENYNYILEKLNKNLAKMIQHQNPEIHKYSHISLSNVQNTSKFHANLSYSNYRKKLEKETRGRLRFLLFIVVIFLLP